MKISVVTISYNSESVIENTILSVVNQTYTNKEFIIIDGASKDGTMDVVKKHIAKIDYAVSEPDLGIYDAMNKGIKAATGDFIIFMNSGDTFYQDNVLEKIVPCINDDTTIAYGDIIKVSKTYKYKATPAPIEKMEQYMTVFHQSTFIRLLYHKKRLFDISYRSSGDYDFFYNAYMKDQVKFQYIPMTIACFDCVDGTSNSNFKRSHRENLRIWGKENDYLFRIKLEYKLSLMALKIWTKKHLLSLETAANLEKKRLRRLGYTIIDN